MIHRVEDITIVQRQKAIQTYIHTLHQIQTPIISRFHSDDSYDNEQLPCQMQTDIQRESVSSTYV